MIKNNRTISVCNHSNASDKIKHYQRLIAEQKKLLKNTNQDRLNIEKTHLKKANQLSLTQIKLAKKIKDTSKLEQTIIQKTRELSDINRDLYMLSELSIDELDLQLQNKIADAAAEENENRRLIQLLQTLKKETSQRIIEALKPTEKEAEIEQAKFKAERDVVKKQLTEELRLSKQLISEESVLKKQLTEALLEEKETTVLLNASETALKETQALYDQKMFLNLHADDLTRSLLLTSNMAFRYALHWRLGFIEQQRGHICQAINHFNLSIKGDPAHYKTGAAEMRLSDLKKQIIRNGTHLSQKQHLEKANKAYKEQQLDEAILYAENAIDLAKKSNCIDEYNILIHVYLQQDDWLGVATIYTQLKNSKHDCALIDNEIHDKIQTYLTKQDLHSQFQLLKITSTDVFRDHCRRFENEEGMLAASDRIAFCRSIQFHELNTPIHLGMLTLELINLFAFEKQVPTMHELLSWITRQPDIPAFLKAWADFSVAEFLIKNGYVQLAQHHYQSALTQLPGFTEARQALQALSFDKTNKARFFQPANSVNAPLSNSVQNSI